MKKYFFLFCIIFLISCRDTDGIIDSYTVSVKEYPDSLNILSFPYEILPLNEPRARSIIKEDSLLILIKPEDDRKIHVYDSRSYKQLGAFISEGRGPGEILILGPVINQVDKKNGEIGLVIQSFPEYIALLNITRSLRENKMELEEKHDFTTDPFRRRLIYGSSVFSIMSDGRFFSSQNPNLGNKNIINPYLFLYDYEKNIITDSMPGSELKKDLVRKMPLIVSCTKGIREGENKVCVAFDYLDAIKIFDFDTKTNIVVKMSEEYPFSTLGKQYATNIITTPDFIFGLSDEMKAGRPVTNMQVLDWEGNILGGFNMGERFFSLWVNEEDRAIYALASNTGDIYKFDIETLYGRTRQGTGTEISGK